ncbi:MAG: hypothetical protein NZ480_09025 [Bdellovibrionaceae bacterium]|nr:hypothetical protein [Pseudobdellovibrionaceae bacterium]MDW8189388.1 hypothetical protein [Pseudobdellovibrionaceae bacterium]
MKISFRKLAKWLPDNLKGPILRKLVKVPYPFPRELKFKVATTHRELEQAFSILHDAYTEEGLITPEKSGIRVTKYHMLPTSSVLVALWNEEVVATVTLIRKSVFGIPSDALFDLSHINGEIAEISSLAVKKPFKNRKGTILFPLFKFLYHYATDFLGVTHFVIAINPKWQDFYYHILLFKKLNDKPVPYDFINHNPAMGGILDLRVAAERYYAHYGQFEERITMYSLFFELPRINMEFPERSPQIHFNSLLAPEEFEWFFIKKSQILFELSEYELHRLHEIYDDKRYRNLIPHPKGLDSKSPRYKRYMVTFYGQIYDHSDYKKIIGRIKITNLSFTGIGGSLIGDLPDASRYHLRLHPAGIAPIDLVISLVWHDKIQKKCGFRVVESNQEWTSFINYLENYLKRSINSEQIKHEESKKSAA